MLDPQSAQMPLLDEPVARRALPVVGEQKDIRYFAALPKSLLNNPAATGMGFWSINPYVGCAFGCAFFPNSVRFGLPGWVY